MSAPCEKWARQRERKIFLMKQAVLQTLLKGAYENKNSKQSNIHPG
jgi:hypothetical protein